MERVTDNDHPANQSGTRVYPDRPVMLDPLTAMAMCAAATETIKLATSVLIAPYRTPLAVAHAFATIDALSGGRVMVGVGSGWEKSEFQAVGASYDDRGPLTEESIEVWKHAWTADWLDHKGEFFEFHDVTLEPKPAQPGGPPVFYGAVSKAGSRRAARVADGLYPMFLDTYVDPARFEPLRDVILKEADKVERDLSDFGWLAFASAQLTDAGNPRSQERPRPTITGTPEQVLEDLQAFADARYSHATVFFDCPSGSIEEFVEMAEQFGTEVIPEANKIEAAPFL
jgi:probable F420-dependent oxidoreductase